MEPVRIGNILIANDRIDQFDESHIVLRILREDFRSGEITHTRVCKRPLILTLIAFAMILLGLLTARGVVDWFLYGGLISKYSIMLVLLVPGGFYFLYQAWRSAPMVIIQTGRGTNRLEFKGDRTKESMSWSRPPESMDTH
jgi:hypothetical protein